MRFLSQASVAVGITALSSEDMYMAAGHGKCVEIFHVIGDTLSQLGKPRLRPDLGPPNMDDSNNVQESTDSNSQQVITDQSEVLPSNLDRLDIGENFNEIESGTFEVHRSRIALLNKINSINYVNFYLYFFFSLIRFRNRIQMKQKT